MNVLTRIAKQREFIIFLIVAAVFVFMSFASPVFFTEGNLLSVMLSLSIESIMAVGMVVLMVGGGFDMSVGSILGFTGIAVAKLLTNGVPPVLAVFLALLIGVVIGLWNGLIVAKLKINPFVTTLSSLSIFRGLSYIFTSGRNISGLPDAFQAIGQTRYLGVQLPIFYAVVILIVGEVLLRNSRFLRQNYYIGANEKAALLSGINVDRMTIFSYVLTAVLAAFAGADGLGLLPGGHRLGTPRHNGGHFGRCEPQGRLGHGPRDLPRRPPHGPHHQRPDAPGRRHLLAAIRRRGGAHKRRHHRHDRTDRRGRHQEEPRRTGREHSMTRRLS